MTPQQIEEAKKKAKELVDRFHSLINYSKIWFPEAKEAAKICCDEIIEAIGWHEFDQPNEEWDFWNEVKNQIDLM